MKKIKILMIVSAGIFAMLFTSCENQDVDFPDFDYSTVYFAYQYPVRTIVLGEDIIDNTLDNEHKCSIYATMGGVYSNDQTIGIDVTVDNNLCNNLFFDGDFTSPVQTMPSNYYSLAADQIILDKTIQDGVEVQLTDAFFADPNALKNTYVIPLRMTNVVNADSILSGVPKIDGAVRGNDTDWDVLPKDFVLYCVKFINPWHGNYLRRGEDVITEGGATSTVTREAEYVEDDEVVALNTASLNTVEFPVPLINENGENVTCTLMLTFDDQNGCTITSATEGFTASGSGSFVIDGEKNSWGNKDRNALYLDYTIDMGSKSYATSDILVVRDRGVAMETFSPSYNVN
ncbi:DUF5627 domain-containing protein [uncultured Draconibacterium sp.]|uniref:DUF5627 domain-containing protein n=1 Tax=uncultured Draconibacterium sp. TaxID=1573823 RepID=UPI002AA6FA40|nr:DUF5627 domain-containing protein [uncultured Draconibacterium sp.]